MLGGRWRATNEGRKSMVQPYHCSYGCSSCSPPKHNIQELYEIALLIQPSPILRLGRQAGRQAGSVQPLWEELLREGWLERLVSVEADDQQHGYQHAELSGRIASLNKTTTVASRESNRLINEFGCIDLECSDSGQG